MSQEVQRIIDAVRALSPQQRQEVLNTLGTELATPPQVSRKELLRSIRGKYADLPTSSQDFCARKREDIERES